MSIDQVQHWIIIGILAFMVVVIAFAAAWSIGKVNNQLQILHSDLRDISGFMTLLAGMETGRREGYNPPPTGVRIEAPSASISVSGGTEGMPTEIPR